MPAISPSAAMQCDMVSSYDARGMTTNKHL